jgi:ribosomal protein S12 methylthiotransferase accessory factor
MQAYSPDMSFHWVWGFSLQQQRAVLIPEQIAYYGAQAMRPEQEQFIIESSNGCAVGGSLEEAMMHGLCEVIERDAFFLTWYARLKVPAIDWRSTSDTELLLAFERSTRMTGFDFYAFDCTMDLNVPVILVMALNRQNQAPRVLLGAAAHPDPDKALATAFFEAASDIVGQSERFPQDLERGKQLLEDSTLILNIEDHVLTGSMPEALPRFQFLLEERPVQTMQERFAAHYARQKPNDLTEELLAIAQHVIQQGYDVIVVDQTAPELQAGGFSRVRVLVPGLVPLTIGHLYRRTHNLPRLYQLPQQLGYTDHILTEADLNTDPHAFP